MAVRNIAVTDTIEKFRTEFNAMTLNDFGDIANLDASLTATNLVDAMNETLSVATNTAGFRIEDSSSSQQLIGGGDILRVLGTSNEIEAVVSATDTLTIGLPNAVSITTSVTAPTVNAGNLALTNGSITDSSGSISFGNENLSTTGTLGAGNITGVNITGTGSTHTFGTIELSGNEIRSTDSTQLKVNDSLEVSGTLKTNNISSASGSNIDLGSSNLITSGFYYTSNVSGGIIFEGATADGFETFINVTDPTADRTITFPDASGTVALTGSTGYATSTIFTSAVTLILYNSSGTPVKTIVGSAT